jgi:hypothetical protein
LVMSTHRRPHVDGLPHGQEDRDPQDFFRTA